MPDFLNNFIRLKYKKIFHEIFMKRVFSLFFVFVFLLLTAGCNEEEEKARVLKRECFKGDF